MNTNVRISVEDAKIKYSSITDEQIEIMGNDLHGLCRLSEDLEKDYRTHNKTPRELYLKRTPEQKKKYYKYVRKNGN